jgi:hypothetical protein
VKGKQMCKLCDDGSEHGHDPASPASRSNGGLGNERMNEMQKIEPQPLWHEVPEKDETGCWIGRYQYYRDENTVDIDCDFVPPPNAEVEPKEIEGTWYWVTPNVKVRGGTIL